jgi:DNA-binding response OmpR family regulator
MRILLVEDDEGFADMLMQVLAKQNYLVDLATDGQMGWEFIETFPYDLILLDVMLPKLDGISLCKQIRNRQNSLPILFLTTQDNKVTGLDSGADDYMVKPCDLEELLARMRALLRRTNNKFLAAIAWGNLCLNPNNCEVTYEGQPLHLTAKEYALLELFLRNPARIFSKDVLTERLWPLGGSPSASTVRGHIKGLRQKLKQVGAANNLNDLIETVHGLGYRLKVRESDREDRIQNGTESLTPPAGVELGLIWQRSKPKYRDRMKVLERAAADLRRHELSAKLQQQALHEAHTLIGALGSFGFDLAADLAKQIEQILQAEVQNRSQIVALDLLIVQLGQLLA